MTVNVHSNRSLHNSNLCFSNAKNSIPHKDGQSSLDAESSPNKNGRPMSAVFSGRHGMTGRRNFPPHMML